MKKKYETVQARNAASGGFILSDGSIVNTTSHIGVCRSIGRRLDTVIQSGICRFASHGGKGGKVIAFEYAELTGKQEITIRTLLKLDDYYKVVTTHDTISEFTPIRKIKFEAE